MSIVVEAMPEAGVSDVAASKSVVAVQEESGPGLPNRRIVETAVVSNAESNRMQLLGRPEGRNLPIGTGGCCWRKTPNGCGGLDGDTLPVALTAFWEAGQSD